MNIGIVAAEDTEMLAIKKLMKEISENKIYNLNFITGKINEKKCILVKSGVGKVNAARTVQVLIDKFSPDYIINVGSAGATSNNLKIKDIVIGESLVQYDFDITDVGDYEKGEIFEVGKYIKSDKRLINLCCKTIEEMKDKDFNIKLGIIASADLFSSDPKHFEEVKNDFNAECVEMEGAAIAQVCFLDNIPFLVIRGISDVPDGNNEVDFHQYLEIASKNAAEILYKLLEKI